MRRATLATFLCAAPLLAAPADASQNLPDRTVLRAAMRHQARAAGEAPVRLPLPERSRGSAASTSRELRQVAHTAGSQRVLVGTRSHRDVAGVAGELRRLGAARLEAFRTIGVLAARVPSGEALVEALRGDPRVGYVERDRKLRISQDPFDTVDAQTGLKFTWSFDDVRAADALAAAGGGSSRTVAVIDTGLDTGHPEFAGRVARTFDTATGSGDVTDLVGHGTFVTGLVAAVDGNGIGGKGVAGNTKVVAVRASIDGGFTVGDLIRGIEFSIERGADVINLSLAGPGFSQSSARALEAAFFADVLPIAASGNNALEGNPIEFPAAALGGLRGRRGIGLSVGATRPSGAVADFSTHNEFVSLAAPGAGPAGCEFGVFSTLPLSSGDWDTPGSCSNTFADLGARFAYGEGTSFSAPIVSGIAALVWQVERRLASEQVADVLVRSARQTMGSEWNEFTGSGIVDGKAATDLARTYDVTAPRVHAKARRRGSSVNVRLRRATDRTEAGRELAGHVTYGLLLSRDGGRSFGVVVGQRTRPFRKSVRLRGRRANVLIGTVCDANGNCGVKRLGRFKAG